MKIEEIKEWLEQGGVTDLGQYGLVIIDALLAEVNTLESSVIHKKQYNDQLFQELTELRTRLATATKALQRIIETHYQQTITSTKYVIMAEIAATALKEVER